MHDYGENPFQAPNHGWDGKWTRTKWLEKKQQLKNTIPFPLRIFYLPLVWSFALNAQCSLAQLAHIEKIKWCEISTNDFSRLRFILFLNLFQTISLE